MPDEPETTTEQVTEVTPDTGTEVTTDWQAETAKWKAMARKHEGEAKANKAAAKELEEIREAQKTAEQKAADKAAQAEAQATKAQREADILRVAMRKGLTETQARRLQGETIEELEADADELLASFAVKEAEEPAEKTTEISKRPTEKLKSGATGSDGELLQLTRDDLKKMNPDQILKAKEDGQLNQLLGMT